MMLLHALPIAMMSVAGDTMIMENLPELVVTGS